MEIISKIESLDSQKVKDAFKELMADYLTPAFGSISKRDFEILLFMKLQSLGVFEKNPEIYDLVTQLRVTRTKARNLLYESKLRHTTSLELDEELRKIVQNPIFLKDNDKIGIEIENPFLIDHLRSKLKKLNHITDGSFSPELVRLTTTAYIALFESLLPKDSKESIKRALVAAGAASDTSFKGIMKSVLKKLGEKFADEAGGKLAESIGDYLGPIISGSVEMVKEKLVQIFNEKKG